MNDEMTNEMEGLASKLLKLAAKYRDVYSQVNGSAPVIWIRHRKTGETLVISDRLNGELILKCIHN